jgi:hypothetical protein
VRDRFDRWSLSETAIFRQLAASKRGGLGLAMGAALNKISAK